MGLAGGLKRGGGGCLLATPLGTGPLFGATGGHFFPVGVDGVALGVALWLLNAADAEDEPETK